MKARLDSRDAGSRDADDGNACVRVRCGRVLSIRTARPALHPDLAQATIPASAAFIAAFMETTLFSVWVTRSSLGRLSDRGDAGR
jgi:hypothetical protein